MWLINSEIYFLTITYAFYLPWLDTDAVKSKMQLFHLSLRIKLKKKAETQKKMIESEYQRFLCDSLIQSSAGRVHNFLKIGVDIPRLIEWAWAGGENFSKHQSFGSELFIYTPSA